MTPRPSSRRRMGPRGMLALVVLAVLATLSWMALSTGGAFPPRTVVMATGPERSTYDEFGARYAQILQRGGVNLRLVQTAGGVENLARLRDPRSGVSIAFVEGGLADRTESPDLVSLGTVSLDPLWLFFRGIGGTSQGSPSLQLVGKRISIEPEGSGTQSLAHRLLALNGLDESKVTLLGLTAEQSAEALLRGEIDVAVMLTSLQSPAVQRLLAADDIVLANFPRADAYIALDPSLSKVVLPTGVADFARNIPPADVQMLAVPASLVVAKDIHPAIQYLLLEAAAEIHSGPAVFYRAGRFPAPEAIDLPLSDQARAFFKSGLPFVYRYLPFWVAGLAERLMILLIPLFTVVFPVAHFLPSIQAFVIQRRIFSLYGDLKVLETELETRGPHDMQELAAALDRLASRANRLRVPLGYSQRLFIVKGHIAQARQEVERRRSTAKSAETTRADAGR